MRFLLGFLCCLFISLSFPVLASAIKVSTPFPNLVSPDDLNTISEYSPPTLIAQASQEGGDASSSEMELDDSAEADIVIGGPEPSEEKAPAEEEKPSEEVTVEPVPKAEPVPAEEPAVVDEEAEYEIQ